MSTSVEYNKGKKNPSKPVTTSRWQGNIYKQNQIVEKNGINNKQ